MTIRTKKYKGKKEKEKNVRDGWRDKVKTERRRKRKKATRGKQTEKDKK